MKIVVDQHIPFIRGILEPYADVVYLEGSKIGRADVRDADAMIIRTRTRCDASLLGNTMVRFIASATIGCDHIDASFCRDHNIVWTNAGGCNSSSVQQYMMAALLHIASKFGFRLVDAVIGIVGVGNVGSKVARLCRAMGMRVLLNDPPRERREGASAFVPFAALVEQADLISLHVPLSREGEDRTYHLIDGQMLSRMRTRQILINTSRGEVVETAAIKSALREKKVTGCILDVWENEPRIDGELLEMVDIGTPHIAGYSADGKANGTAMSVRAVSRFFGFGLDQWYPGDVPAPERTKMEIDCRELETEEVLRNLVQFTYDIRSDDSRLRVSPQTFEQQRALYPPRREFPSYMVKLLNASEGVRYLVREFGFQAG